MTQPYIVFLQGIRITPKKQLYMAITKNNVISGPVSEWDWRFEYIMLSVYREYEFYLVGVQV